MPFLFLQNYQIDLTDLQINDIIISEKSLYIRLKTETLKQKEVFI